MYTVTQSKQSNCVQTSKVCPKECYPDLDKYNRYKPYSLMKLPARKWAVLLMNSSYNNYTCQHLQVPLIPKTVTDYIIFDWVLFPNVLQSAPSSYTPITKHICWKKLRKRDLHDREKVAATIKNWNTMEISRKVE